MGSLYVNLDGRHGIQTPAEQETLQTGKLAYQKLNNDTSYMASILTLLRRPYVSNGSICIRLKPNRLKTPLMIPHISMAIIQKLEVVLRGQPGM